MTVSFKVDNLKSMNEQLKAFADFLIAQRLADEDVFLSRLVSCELITNVIRHGGEAAEFRGELLADKIVISVTADSQKKLPVDAVKPDVLAESGRGMYIVNEVSLSGIHRGENGEFIVYIKRSP